jgi:hypothetical protein
MTEKQAQFNAAMRRFEAMPVYRWTGRFLSFANVSLQLALGALALTQPIRAWSHGLAFAVAYVLADFVNGWVHLYMDSNDRYEGWSGPFMAAFHLHHRTPKYQKRPLIVVYYLESGSKLWLFFVELVFLLGILSHVLTGFFAYAAFYFAILSSAAEVCHYLCHVRKPAFAKVLERLGLILSTRYHARHHREDNVQYTFLNGMTDPLLNLIAKKFYSGYKLTTDTHYATYVGSDTENRQVTVPR